MTFFVCLLSFYSLEEETKRPCENGKNGQEKRQKKDEKRREKSKTGSWTDISVERKEKSQKKRDQKTRFSDSTLVFHQNYE
jgi:hypothetical protein